jgi:AcrR family transcriptional regulator
MPPFRYSRRKVFIRRRSEAAGIADGTIYNYFENKTALLSGIFNRLNQSDQREEQFAASSETDDLYAYFRKYIGVRYQVFDENGMRALQVLIAELMTNPEIRELYMKQTYEPTVAIGEHYFQQWAERSDIDLPDAQLTIRIISAMFLGLSVLRIMGDKPLAERWDELPDFITNFVWNNIGRGK